MLQNNRNFKGQPQQDDWESGAEPLAGIDFDRMIAIANRQWRVVGLAIAVAVVLGVAYLLTAVPKYTAVTDVMIDQNTSKIADQLSALGGGLEDEAAILSQVELLKSDKIGLAVVDKLDLGNDPTFMSSAGSPLSRLKDLLRTVLNVGSWFASTELTPRRSRRRPARHAPDDAAAPS